MDTNNPKYISTELAKSIFNNAPKGTDQTELLNEMVGRGYVFQGYNEPTPESTLVDKAKKVAGSIINPIERLGGTVAQGIHDITGIGTNLYDANNQATGAFGNKVDLLGTKEGQVLDNKGTAKDITGNVLQNVAMATPVGTSLSGASLGSKVLQGAKVGGITGAEFGAGQALNDQKSTADILKSTAIGGAAGAAIGGAIPLVSAGIKNSGRVFGAVKEKINPTVESISKENTKILSKVGDSKATLRNYVSLAKEKGFNPVEDISKTDLLKGAVDSNGTLRTKGAGGAVEQYNEFLKPQEGIVNKVIQQEGRTVPVSGVEQLLTDAVNNSSIKGSAKSTAMEGVKKEIAGLMLDADANGNIPISVIHEAKVSKYGNINYLNPEAGTSDKLIAKTLKQIVEDNVSANVKALNEELARHYTNIGFLEKLDGAKVEGGRLGKHFARVVGGMIGSHFGPLGTIAGSEVAGKLSGASLESQLAKGAGQELKSSALMQKAIKSVKK